MPSSLLAQQDAPAPPPARSHLRNALPRRQYLCANGESIVTLLESNAVRLTYMGQVHNLRQIEAGPEAKFSDGLMVWAVTGDVWTLRDVSVKDQPKDVAQNCLLQTSFPPAKTVQSRIEGSIRLPKGLTLLPTAEVVVELRDVFLADAPSPVLAEYKVALGKPEGPIPFSLSIDPAKIDAKHPYAVEVRVLAGGRLRATNDTQYLVLTQGNPSQVDIILVKVPRTTVKP